MGSLSNLGTSLVAHWQRNLPAMQEPQEMRVQSLGLEDPLEEGMQPTPVFLPGESHRQWSLVVYTPLGRKESDMAEAT